MERLFCCISFMVQKVRKVNIAADKNEIRCSWATDRPDAAGRSTDSTVFPLLLPLQRPVGAQISADERGCDIRMVFDIIGNGKCIGKYQRRRPKRRSMRVFITEVNEIQRAANVGKAHG